ncbi:hypothetical protein EC991_001806 [Linnemannia zychae]|nr:hypothetical protein EC991_001806 [Linnemannia zychae]
MDHQQREQWAQYQGNATATSDSGNTLTSPNPPVLSFRAFHATHFSWSQRQAFFSGRSPAPWAHSYPPFAPPHPAETDTLADPPESKWDTSYPDNAQLYPTAEAEIAGPHINNATTEASAASAEYGGEEAATFGLTQEAIEIFEFSRRFREEKAAALALERAQMARRRTKRRRLARRGFAPDEGNSGSDDALEADQGDDSKRDDLDDKGNESEDGDDAGEEEDDGQFAQMEPPATDTAFLTQPSRQRDRTRERLYGVKKSGSKDLDTFSVSTSTNTTTSTSTQDDMWSIRMLEAMLNQTFINSLGPENSSFAAVPENNRRRSRDSGRGARGAVKSRSSQQSQVVYWPGMPMRC